MIQQWIKDINPEAAKIIDHYQDVREFGKSNPYLIKIDATGIGKPQTIPLFGANLYRFLPPSGLVSYVYSTYTYEELLANTMFSPFEIGILRITSNIPNNLTVKNPKLTVIKNEPTGERKVTNFAVFRRLNQFQQDAIEFDITDYRFAIDGDVEFYITVYGGITNLYFYPSARASFKLLMNEGRTAKKNTMPSIPLTPNRQIYYEPVPVKMRDNGSKIIV